LSAAYVGSDGTNDLTKAGLAFVCHGNGFNLRALTGLNEKVEVGVGYLNVDKNVGDAHAFTIAGKVKLLEKPESNSTLSAGLAFRNWSADMTIEVSGEDVKADLPNATSLYVVWDKGWGQGVESAWDWTTSLGLAYDSYSSSHLETSYFFGDVEGIPIDSDGTVASESFIEPFVGVKLTNGEWTILGDYKFRERKGNFNYASAIWSLAARKEINPGVTATLGITNFNLPYTDSDPALFLDLSYRR
jgi:hypothetical protein